MDSVKLAAQILEEARGGKSVSEIANALGVPVQLAGKVIEALVITGYMWRRGSTRDTVYAPTERGIEFAEQHRG
jgi:predicted transcriptional regulator